MKRFYTRVRCGNHFLLVLTLAVLSAACGKQENAPVENVARPTSADAEREGEQIAERYRALDNSNQSVSNLLAVVKDADGSTREVAMSISRKLAPDGRRLMLVEFTSPAEERDRNALVIINPQGNIEATRYIQSNNTFVSVNNVVSEDSLFGMTMQELADGQTEKYTFRLVGEESFEGKPAHRIEGKLKEGMESKFPRLVLLISKENFAALVAEFYDNQNQLIRRVNVDQMAQHNGHWTRMRWVVDNLARQKKISFETIKIAYDGQLNDAIFSRDHLKKITSR
ncbi:MAG TPA: outer membrane lipoprotein-sorting protein [Blastocatellia bacterium]|nr:outer membrane lipoprotein-sorting protein [Blastocatellia bacterium]